MNKQLGVRDYHYFAGTNGIENTIIYNNSLLVTGTILNKYLKGKFYILNVGINTVAVLCL